ncbi:hypothetical protein N752_12860 [Desulforamulus aquiferis]|nr:hypothetical protein N752_12860 [Desulforamulus aquiferis]
MVFIKRPIGRFILSLPGMAKPEDVLLRAFNMLS